MIAYDFETTRIEAGTPRPLYLTAYAPDFQCEQPIRDMSHLHKLLVTEFLSEERDGAKYVAWNGNRFDAYFVAAALIQDNTYRLLPYMTKSKSLRGLRVELALDEEGNEIDSKEAPSWEFLDGIAMLGLAGVSLAKLLDNFCPDLPKLKEVINFEAGEEFDPKNKKHREYAMRDSVGLWHAMDRAQRIIHTRFNEPLNVTMGGVCIKIFQANLPRETIVKPLIPDLEQIVREYAMRGGYCYCVKRYTGPIWKYDINQAYAAAMRQTSLPAGDFTRGYGRPKNLNQCFLVRITAKKPDNIIPFYYRTEVNGRIKTMFSGADIQDTWITSTEYHQLIDEGWGVVCKEHWSWDAKFSMQEYVDKLETMRMTCEGGPSGPIGTMLKAVGNHSYGKTVENIEPIEYVLAQDCPDDCLPFYGDSDSPIEHIFYRMDLDRKAKAHHQPQIGAFITAHVRMVLRRAALLSPHTWLYADTDCVVFSESVSDRIDIDSKRYGAWKIEESGTQYRIIAKKVYAEIGGEKPHHSAKGLNVKRLTPEDFERWSNGEAPEQEQTQINNILAVLCGEEMYRTQKRKGTKVTL